MKIIDKYIFRQLFGPFVFATLAFSFVFVGVLFFPVFDLISKYNAHWTFALQLIALRIPAVIVPVIPVSMLLATLLTFGKLSGNSEITAMKSGGMSFFRIMLPVLLLGFLVSTASFAANQFLTPWANRQYNYIEDSLIKKTAAADANIQKDIIIKGVANTENGNYALIFARQFDKSSGLLSGITAQEFTGSGLSRIITAASAGFSNNSWELTGCEFYTLDKQSFGKATSIVIPVSKRPELVIADQKDPEELEFRELLEVYRSLKNENSPDFRKFETEIFNRAAIPFAGVIFALVGAPLGMQSNRSSSSVGLGLSLVIILLYYAIYSFMLTLGKGGVVNGFIAAWTPNITGMLFGFYLVHRARKK